MRRPISVALCLACLLLSLAPAEAGFFGRRRAVYRERLAVRQGCCGGVQAQYRAVYRGPAPAPAPAASAVFYAPAPAPAPPCQGPTCPAPQAPAKTLPVPAPQQPPATTPALVPVQPSPMTATRVTTTATYAGDAYGFTAWLNAVRAQHGLAAVGFDPALAGWAASNNNAQAAHGMGHFVMGPSRFQNAAVGNAVSIRMQWLNSPAHRAAMLNPSITRIGLAGYGQYWTLNAL